MCSVSLQRFSTFSVKTHFPSPSLSPSLLSSVRPPMQLCSHAGVRADRRRYIQTRAHALYEDVYVLIRRLLRWNGKSLLSPTEHKPRLIANLYVSLSVSALGLSLLTPPTPSSVVSYSAHVLILPLRPHVLQTLGKVLALQ